MAILYAFHDNIKALLFQYQLDIWYIFKLISNQKQEATYIDYIFGLFVAMRRPDPNISMNESIVATINANAEVKVRIVDLKVKS